MKLRKIFIILCIALFLVTIQNISFAAGDTAEDAGVITDRAKDWIELGEKDSIIDSKPATKGFEEIAGLLWGIGIFIAVAVGMILGIRFMLSTPKGKAEISSLLTPYIIGVVIIVGALTIWRIVINLLDV